MRTYQIDPEMRNEELRKAQEELEASRRKYIDLYDFAPVGYFTFEANGLIREVNLTGADLLGLNKRLLIGKPFSRFIIPDDQALFQTHRIIALKTFDRQTCEIRIKRKNGPPICVQMQSIGIEKGEDNAAYCRSTATDVTERKRTEEALRKSEERYRNLVENSPETVFVNRNNRIVFVNPAGLQLFGATNAEQLVGKSPFEVFHSDYHPIMIGRIRQVMEGKSVPLIEEKIVRLDGTVRDVEVVTIPFADMEGPALQIILRDITERKRAEDELRKAKEELETRVQKRTAELAKINEELETEISIRRKVENALIEQSKTLEAFFKYTLTPVVILDRSFNFIGVNEAYAKACHRDISAFPGHNHFEFYPHEENEAIFRQVVETKTPYQATAKPFIFPDHPEWGVTYWDWTLMPILDEAGTVEFLVFSLNDVTAHVQFVDKLFVFKSLINQSSDLIFVVDPGTGALVESNESAQKTLGFSQEELAAKKVMDFAVNFPDLGHWKEHVRELMGKGGMILEDRLLRKDGTTFPVEVSVRHIAHEEKGYLVEVVRDITERKETDERIRATNTVLKLFIQKVTRKEYLDAVVEMIRSWDGCRHVGISVLDECGNIPYESHAGFSPGFLESESMLSVESAQCSCIRVITEEMGPQEASVMTPNGSFYSNDTVAFLKGLAGEERSKFPGVCMQSGFASVAVIPIRHRGKVLGAVHIADEKEGMVPLKVVEFIEVMAFIIGEAIYRFKAEEDLRTSQEQLRNLTAHLEAVREEERTYIAREIHDELGQALTALKMDVSWLGNKCKEHDHVLEKTKSMSELIDETIRMVQKIISELRPGILDNLGIVAAVEWFAKDFQKRMGIPCEVSFSHENIALDSERSTVIFRVFQETLTNIARHAEATRIEASLEVDQGKIVLIVKDNGKGITEEQLSDPQSFGLIGMRERVQFLGGEIEIKGVPERGTAVTVNIPLH